MKTTNGTHFGPHLLLSLSLCICCHVAAGFSSPKSSINSIARRSHFATDISGGVDHDVAPISRDRRNFISLALAGANMALLWTKGSVAAFAEDSDTTVAAPPRPFAPLEALLPAALQRSLLKSALELTTTALKGDTSTPPENILQQLQAIIEPPLETATPQRRAISMTRRYILDQKELLTHPISRLSGRTFRAAMNVYTSNLRFGESYFWNAPRSETKRWIRENGQLPSVQQVITADLDLRDLYRNQVQTRIEDAQAELYNQNQGVDLEELNSLLSEATEASDKWFQLISIEDLQQAQLKLEALSEQGLDNKKADGILVQQLPKQKFDGYNFFTDD